MSGSKIHSLTALSLLSSPIALPPPSLSPKAAAPASSITTSSDRSSLRSMKYRLATAPTLQPKDTYVGEQQERWQFPSDHLLIEMTMNGFAATALSDDKVGECHYLTPTHPVVGDTFFHELIVRGNDENETFQSIAIYLEQTATSCHRFQFKYPLKNKDQAQIFAKVLQIKAQEAHRFVPVISSSQFIESSHLGFIRKINIYNNGPAFQEHVLVNRDSNQVMFIEELGTDPDGNIQLGSFAALNGIVEEHGSWYFVGTYLYNSEPEVGKIDGIVQMFQDTYENMISFTENENVDSIYNQLREY